MSEDEPYGAWMDAPPPDQLSTLLGQVADAKRRKEALAAELKTVNEELDALESMAAEQIKASGLDGCRAAGFSWSISETLRLHVPKDNRDAVIRAAAQEGLGDEVVTVQTATLKAWLNERLERAKADGKFLEKPSEGTAFEGLLSEYIEIRLASRKVS